MTDVDKVIQHFQDAIEASGKNNKWRFVRLDIIEDTIALLKKQPEIIRCKDCKNWKPGEIVRDNFIPPRCDLNGSGWSSDNYCSWAIRKED